MRYFTLLFFLTWSFFSCSNSSDLEKDHPNIVYVLADDMGYGDVSFLNNQSKIKTSNLDALAGKGMIFTDAHSGSSVCTPTRYGLLTGRYAWRTRMKKGVLWSFDQHLIDPQRMTVATLLKKHGYHTACIGKWHLGLDWAKDSTGNWDFTQAIQNGPNANGFDYFFGINSSLDIPPYFYIENDRITATGIDSIGGNDPDGKAFWRPGKIGNDFEHIEVLPRLAKRAEAYIKERAASDAPFFLYLALPAPHTPILPIDEFVGESGTNAYGDFVLMVDDMIGELMNVLDNSNLSRNTLFIFTSDNGCSPRADFNELATKGHHPSYVFRGHKADIFEGGHRVPFIVRWPAAIQPGSISRQTICLTDLMATCAAIVGANLPENAGEDSYNILPLLQGENFKGPLREATVHHSIDGSFAIRQGNWKLSFCRGSGGWSDPTPAEAIRQGLYPIQLYNLDKDLGEMENVANQYPDIVKKLTNLMHIYVEQGRSTPGAPQTNEGKVVFLPSEREKHL